MAQRVQRDPRRRPRRRRRPRDRHVRPRRRRLRDRPVRRRTPPSCATPWRCTSVHGRRAGGRAGGGRAAERGLGAGRAGSARSASGPARNGCRGLRPWPDPGRDRARTCPRSAGRLAAAGRAASTRAGRRPACSLTGAARSPARRRRREHAGVRRRTSGYALSAVRGREALPRSPRARAARLLVAARASTASTGHVARRRHRPAAWQGAMRHVRAVHRPRPSGGRPGPRRGPDAQPQLHRHRAHPARPHPRGRGRRRQGAGEPRHLAGGRARPGRGDHRPGPAGAVRPHPVHARAPRRCSSCPCARRCSSATTTSAPSTSCSA